MAVTRCWHSATRASSRDLSTLIVIVLPPARCRTGEADDRERTPTPRGANRTLSKNEAFCAGNGTASERGGQQFPAPMRTTHVRCIGDDESDNSDRDRATHRAAEGAARCNLCEMRHKTGTKRACAVSCLGQRDAALLVACERAPEPEPCAASRVPRWAPRTTSRWRGCRRMTRVHEACSTVSTPFAQRRRAPVDVLVHERNHRAESQRLDRLDAGVGAPVRGARCGQPRQRRNGGAFDVTVAPFVRLWGFGPGGEQDAAPELPPSPEFIHDAAAITGYTWLELRASPDRAVRKNRTPLELDVNGIAPGYAVDRISGCLTRARFAGPPGRDRR